MSMLYRPDGLPQEVTFDGKTFQLQTATRLDTYQEREEAGNQSLIFEHPTDFFTDIKGSRMEEKVGAVWV
jgi:hypothetical protein